MSLFGVRGQGQPFCLTIKPGLGGFLSPPPQPDLIHQSEPRYVHMAFLSLSSVSGSSLSSPKRKVAQNSRKKVIPP